MQVWFGGSECADAVCDVLFGDSVPCGKLTASFPRTTGQEPLYYNHLPTGRPLPEGEKSFTKFKTNYLDVRNDPLYCFGYGLSYTTFGLLGSHPLLFPNVQGREHKGGNNRDEHRKQGCLGSGSALHP